MYQNEERICANKLLNGYIDKLYKKLILFKYKNDVK